MKIKKDKLMVIGVSLLALVLIIGFIVSKFSSEEAITNDNLQQVVVSETGEASSINLGVPVSQIKNDSLSYLERLEQIKNDSINRAKVSDVGIGTVAGSPSKGGAQNSRLYGDQDDELVKSVQSQLAQMEATKPVAGKTYSGSGGNASGTTNSYSGQSKETSEREYRERLLNAKKAKRERSSDYSRPLAQKSAASVNSNIKFRCAIYRDQLILPGDRVTLLLTQPLVYQGNLFEKNTFIYATAALNKSRVLLDIQNINHVPISLEARDLQDGELGLYSPRAGELWREFQDDVQSRGVDGGLDEISKTINVPVVGPAIRAFGSFFTNKRYRESDKIPLWNDRELILTTKIK